MQDPVEFDVAFPRVSSQDLLHRWLVGFTEASVFFGQTITAFVIALREGAVWKG